eukprot:TRINITY_DN1103_c0_g1_i2.p1 TRINITY_DN1103_c0_g1~~TRINITY_DN1103_c0_g1_i2.p1  ORF type:complete len:369 (-),score=29.71 TRINITY_DN1103_c0_g1_i2:59-1084(-)
MSICQYLAEKSVHTLLKSALIEVCLHKPEDPIAFLAQHLAALNSSKSKPQRKRRGAVSAEPLRYDASVVSPVVIPKDAETAARLRQSLSRNVLFSHLDESQQQAVFDALFECSFCKNETVISQGDEGDNFYIVEEGTLNIFVKRPGTPAEKVMTVSDGDFFGELALIYGCPRAATVIAVSEVKLWAIDRITYRSILMETTMRKRKMYEGCLSQVPIFKNLDKYERSIIADAVVEDSFQPNDIIVQEGDSGEEFYIILKGEVTVTQANGVEVGHLKEMDYFGEISLLTAKPRVASVNALTSVQCIKLDRERFTRLLGPVEDILRRNMADYRNYLNEPSVVGP